MLTVAEMYLCLSSNLGSKQWIAAVSLFFTGGMGEGSLSPLKGTESLHPRKGLYVFKALALRGLERPVVRLTHDERRSYRFVCVERIDTDVRGPPGVPVRGPWPQELPPTTHAGETLCCSWFWGFGACDLPFSTLPGVLPPQTV